jgi:hypothetical protein
MRPARKSLFFSLLLGYAFAGAQSREAEFRKLAEHIAALRQAGAEEDKELQQRALALLDEAAIAGLHSVPRTAAPHRLPNLDVVAERLQALMAEPSRIGEGYVPVQAGAESPQMSAPVYAVVVNFSLSGPSAVRLYEPQRLGGTGAQQRWSDFRLVAQIDRFTHPDFFDEYLEVVAMNPGAGVFVTVTGRTDSRKTGSFAAWRYAGKKLAQVWASDLLEHSSYESRDGVLRLDYCAEPDEEKPTVCRKMVRERYAWEGGWTRRTQEDITPKTAYR